MRIGNIKKYLAGALASAMIMASTFGASEVNAGTGNMSDGFKYSGECKSDVVYSFWDKAGYWDTAGVMVLSKKESASWANTEQYYDKARPWEADINNITALFVEDGITSLGGYGFKDAKKLFMVQLASSVRSLGDDEFANSGISCLYAKGETPEVGTIKFPEGISVDSCGTFENCDNIKKIVFSSSIMGLETGVFKDCDGLTSVEIPDTLMYMSPDVFSGCSNLESVTIGKGVKKMFFSPFAGPNKVVEFKIDEENPNYAVIDGCIVEKSTNALIQYPSGNKDVCFTVPDGIKSIKQGAFKGATNLETVVLPDSVTSISQNAFENMPNLTSIYIPKTVSTIGENIIDANSNVKIYTDDTIENLNNKLIIGGNTNGWKDLTNSEPVGNHTHSYSTKTVAPTCTKEGRKSFACECGHAKSIEFIKATGHSFDAGVVTKQPTTSTEGVKTFTCSICGYKKTEVVAKLTAMPITKPATPKKGQVITDKKVNAVVKVTVADTKKGEVEYVKPANKSKSSVVIPDTITINGFKYKVTSIKAKAFKGNKKLKKVSIGKNIKKIGKQAFYGCKNLKTVTIKTTKLTTKKVGSKAFTGIHKKATVKVPKKKFKVYKKLLKKRGISKKTQKIKK